MWEAFVVGAGVTAFGLVSWFVFRASMRRPNNGNEFSNGGIPGGPSL